MLTSVADASIPARPVSRRRRGVRTRDSPARVRPQGSPKVAVPPSWDPVRWDCARASPRPEGAGGGGCVGRDGPMRAKTRGPTVRQIHMLSAFIGAGTSSTPPPTCRSSDGFGQPSVSRHPLHGHPLPGRYDVVHCGPSLLRWNVQPYRTRYTVYIVHLTRGRASFSKHKSNIRRWLNAHSGTRGWVT